MGRLYFILNTTIGIPEIAIIPTSFSDVKLEDMTNGEDMTNMQDRKMKAPIAIPIHLISPNTGFNFSYTTCPLNIKNADVATNPRIVLRKTRTFTMIRRIGM